METEVASWIDASNTKEDERQSDYISQNGKKIVGSLKNTIYLWQFYMQLVCFLNISWVMKCMLGKEVKL